MKIKITVILSVIAVIAVLASCGPANDPEAVAKAFMDALKKGDFNKAADYATEESAQALKMLAAFGDEAMGEASGELEDMEYSITGSNINGDTATVTVESEGQSSDLILQKENGKWKVAFDKEGMMAKEA